jgi:rubredoxin
MDMSTIAAAYQSLNIIKTTFDALLGLKIDSAALQKVTDALQKVTAVQDTLFQAQSRLFELQGKVEALTKDLEAEKKWNSTIASYKLIRTSGGALVYAFQGEPSHHACPACASKQQIQPLQNHHNYAGTHECPSCKYKYPVDSPPPNQAIVAKSDWDPYA